MPTLKAHVDPDSDTLTISVSHDGQKYEHIETDAEILIQNQQFVQAHERPILTLLTLYQRELQAVEESIDELENGDLEDLPTQ